MRAIFYSIVFALLLTSCGVRDTKAPQPEPAAADSIGIDFAARAAAFEQRKQEMLEIADRTGGFVFSDDAELEALDPHAFWLMNRMMQMVPLIKTADDSWAWMLAMNESVEAYNRRLGREIGSADAAMLAIGELNNIYNAGNQPELNTASYVYSILAHYKAVCAYHRIIDRLSYYEDNEEEVRLRNLCYREFCEWFDLNNAVNGIMYFYTYAAARYSALPMDINGLFDRWSRARAEELDIEYDVCWSYDRRTPYKSDAKRVSPRKFDKLIACFKGRTRQDIIKEIMSDWVEPDYDFANEYTEGCYDFDKIAEMVFYYETALRNWRVVREQIARSLKDKEQQRSYRELTRQTHTRLYNDLEELKKIRY